MLKWEENGRKPTSKRVLIKKFKKETDYTLVNIAIQGYIAKKLAHNKGGSNNFSSIIDILTSLLRVENYLHKEPLHTLIFLYKLR